MRWLYPHKYYRVRDGTSTKMITVTVPRFTRKFVEHTVGPFPTYCTNHPAALLPDRDPSLIHAVLSHLQMVSHAVHETAPDTSACDNPTYTIGQPPPTPIPILISLDIETYGIVEGRPEQRHFHPVKSIEWDGCPRARLIETVALSWVDPHSQDFQGLVKSTVFIWRNPKHRRLLLAWLRQARVARSTVLCMHTLFDLSYLRAADPQFREALQPPLMLEDVSTWRYLDNAAMPEKGLKALARLHGLTAPSKPSEFHRYPSPEDPDLLAYNVSDTLFALRLQAIFRTNCLPLARSNYTRYWFSRLLWSCLSMFEAGVNFDPVKLSRGIRHHRHICDRLSADALDQGYGPINGKGSASVIQRHIDTAVADLPHDVVETLSRTDIAHEFSSDALNLQIILSNLPHQPMDPLDPCDSYRLRRPLEALRERRKAVKLLSTYFNKLARPGDKPAKRQDLIRGRAYPHWYVTPFSFGQTGGKGRTPEGGTRQGRLSCSSPALQTLPPPVMACLTSRFRPGLLLGIDLNQAELRYAALLSGDEVLLDAFRRGIDLHARMAERLFGDVTPLWRAVAKAVNFWDIYRGGPKILWEMVLRRTGKDLGTLRCNELHADRPYRYPQLYAWQDELIRQVTRDGYVTEPVLGERRLLTKSEMVNSGLYESTICNFPIQVASARLTQDIQQTLSIRTPTCQTTGELVLNEHDAVWIDCPTREKSTWEKNFANALTHSVYRSKLEETTGRTVPFTWESKILSFRP